MFIHLESSCFWVHFKDFNSCFCAGCIIWWQSSKLLLFLVIDITWKFMPMSIIMVFPASPHTPPNIKIHSMKCSHYWCDWTYNYDLLKRRFWLLEQNLFCVVLTLVGRFFHKYNVLLPQHSLSPYIRLGYVLDSILFFLMDCFIILCDCWLLEYWLNDQAQLSNSLSFWDNW